MKRTLRISFMVCGLILFTIGIILLIIAGKENRELLYAEQNLQIETFGIYREDFHMLNQIEEQKAVCFKVIFGITNVILGIIINLFATIKLVFCNCKN